MSKLYGKIFTLISFGLYLLTYVNFAFASGGEDIAKEPMQNFFATVLGTGLDALLVMEGIYGIYLFSSGQARSMKTFVGLPVVILITTYLKVKFGG